MSQSFFNQGKPTQATKVEPTPTMSQSFFNQGKPHFKLSKINDLFDFLKNFCVKPPAWNFNQIFKEQYFKYSMEKINLFLIGQNYLYIFCHNFRQYVHKVLRFSLLLLVLCRGLILNYSVLEEVLLVCCLG